MRGMTRRRWLQNAMGVSAALALPLGVRAPSANAAGTQLRKYLEPVPLPGARDRGRDRIIYRVQANPDRTATSS